MSGAKLHNNVMWVQISIYVLVLVCRFAAFGIHSLFLNSHPVSFEPEIVRLGVDFALIGIAMPLGATTVLGFQAFRFKGMPFICWFAILSILFIITYILFISMRDMPVDLRNLTCLFKYSCELMFGGSCLVLGGVITGMANITAGD